MSGNIVCSAYLSFLVCQGERHEWWGAEKEGREEGELWGQKKQCLKELKLFALYIARSSSGTEAS